LHRSKRGAFASPIAAARRCGHSTYNPIIDGLVRLYFAKAVVNFAAHFNSEFLNSWYIG